MDDLAGLRVGGRLRALDHPHARLLHRGDDGIAASTTPQRVEQLRLVVSVARKHLRPGLALMELISAGKIKPVIDKVLPLEQAREGLRLIESREVIGKVIVTP